MIMINMLHMHDQSSSSKQNIYLTFQCRRSRRFDPFQETLKTKNSSCVRGGGRERVSHATAGGEHRGASTCERRLGEGVDSSWRPHLVSRSRRTNLVCLHPGFGHWHQSVTRLPRQSQGRGRGSGALCKHARVRFKVNCISYRHQYYFRIHFVTKNRIS